MEAKQFSCDECGSVWSESDDKIGNLLFCPDCNGRLSTHNPIAEEEINEHFTEEIKNHIKTDSEAITHMAQVSRTKVYVLAGICFASGLQTLLFLGPNPGVGHGLISVMWPVSLFFGMLEMFLAVLVLVFSFNPGGFLLKMTRVIAGFIIVVALFVVVVVAKSFEKDHDAIALGWSLGNGIRRMIIPAFVLILFPKTTKTVEK